MEDKILEKIKKRIKEREKQREELQKLRKQLEIVIQNKEVRRYINLKEKEKELKEKRTDLTEEKIIEIEFDKELTKLKNKDTQKIYFYQGSFYDDYGEAFQVPENDEKASYKIYTNIENLESLIVSIEKSEEFENENKIIKPAENINNQAYFRELRYNLLKDLITIEQKSAYQKVYKLIKTKK